MLKSKHTRAGLVALRRNLLTLFIQNLVQKSVWFQQSQAFTWAWKVFIGNKWQHRLELVSESTISGQKSFSWQGDGGE